MSDVSVTKGSWTQLTHGRNKAHWFRGRARVSACGMILLRVDEMEEVGSDDPNVLHCRMCWRFYQRERERAHELYKEGGAVRRDVSS